jgi:hypothetical protein
VHQARVRADFVSHFVEEWTEMDKVVDEVKDEVAELDAPCCSDDTIAVLLPVPSGSITLAA